MGEQDVEALADLVAERVIGAIRAGEDRQRDLDLIRDPQLYVDRKYHGWGHSTNHQQWRSPDQPHSALCGDYASWACDPRSTQYNSLEWACGHQPSTPDERRRFDSDLQDLADWEIGVDGKSSLDDLIKSAPIGRDGFRLLSRAASMWY